MAKILKVRLEKFGLFDSMLVQDYMVPLKRLTETLEFGHDESKLYPVWLCPCRDEVFPPRASISRLPEIYVDVGYYG